MGLEDNKELDFNNNKKGNFNLDDEATKEINNDAKIYAAGIKEEEDVVETQPDVFLNVPRSDKGVYITIVAILAGIAIIASPKSCSTQKEVEITSPTKTVKIADIPKNDITKASIDTKVVEEPVKIKLPSFEERTINLVGYLNDERRHVTSDKGLYNKTKDKVVAVIPELHGKRFTLTNRQYGKTEKFDDLIIGVRTKGNQTKEGLIAYNIIDGTFVSKNIYDKKLSKYKEIKLEDMTNEEKIVDVTECKIYINQLLNLYERELIHY